MRVKNRQLTTNEQHLIDLALIFFLKIYKFCDCDDYLFDLLRTVSRYARKACRKRFLWGERVFERKIFNFSFKTRSLQRNPSHAFRA